MHIWAVFHIVDMFVYNYLVQKPAKRRQWPIVWTPKPTKSTDVQIKAICMTFLPFYKPKYMIFFSTCLTLGDVGQGHTGGAA